MRAVDVLVVGGEVSSLQAVFATKSTYPEKEIILIRKEPQALIPCGIPYSFSSLDSSDKNILPDKVLTSVGVEIVIDEVSDILVEDHTCQTKSGGMYKYAKLILALGSNPRCRGFRRTEQERT